MTDENIDGALAAALAKAQAAFPPITRDKEVTVTTKTGGSYKFSYAPLESILNATRGPLSENGLAVVQLLDDGDLVTMLMHDSGARLAGRVTIPGVDGLQALGSAITYLRRYSIQSILGIATEEDDDGNHASGNTATFGGSSGSRVRAQNHASAPAAAKATQQSDDGGLIGTAVTQGTADFELRQSPDGWSLPFRVKEGGKSFIVLAHDALAEALHAIKATVIDQRVTVWGHWGEVVIPGKTTYQVLHLERIQTPDGILPAPSLVEPEQPDFDMAALDAELAS